MTAANQGGSASQAKLQDREEYIKSLQAGALQAELLLQYAEHL